MLFGDSPPPGLVGIAKLAAASEVLEAKRSVEYFEIGCRSALNRTRPGLPFEWSLNPYRGCEFGCRYCYARYTHEFMELRDSADFEDKIYAKSNLGPILERELKRLDGKGGIAIGTATDPYQPAEREFGATRAILERIAAREGLSVSITTKSNQVVRDIDLLKRITERSSITIHMTITTLRTRLARLLEPRAPRPDLRLDAVRQLRAAGIAAGVNAMPILPGLTDSEKDLDALFGAARDAGAQWVAANVLFLMPASWGPFFSFLEEKFPKLAGRYREWYRGYGYAPDTYKQQIAALVERLRRKHGLGERGEDAQKRSWVSPQIELGLTTGG